MKTMSEFLRELTAQCDLARKEVARLKAKDSRNPEVKDAISNLEVGIREREATIALYARRDRF